MNTFGRFFKARREALSLTLRSFCLKHNIDPSNLSKLERGRVAPPHGEKLREYAKALELQDGSNEWYEFYDLAAAEAGRIPVDLLE